VQTLYDVIAFHPHYDVWALIAALTGGYFLAIKRIGPLKVPNGAQVVSWRQVQLFSGGLLLMWIVSDWPFHDIGENSMFTFHMIEHLVIALGVAPMLLMGIPKWMGQLILDFPLLARLVKIMSHPAVAFVLFNLTLAAIHWPVVVTAMVTIPVVHFGVHASLFVTGLLLWMPILSPLPEILKISRPAQIMYLFANSLIPTIPSAFLIFGVTPLYSTYRDTPKLWGWDAMTDQAVAGTIMKLGGGFLLWAVITAISIRWYAEQKAWDQLEAELRFASE
jgi:putative membrane protein